MNIIRHQAIEAARVAGKDWNALSTEQTADRPHYIGLDRPFTLPACSGNCDQGRKLCVTPDACRLPEDCEPGEGSGVFVWPAVMALALFAVLAVVHLWSAA